jgi:hypothetical protein
VPIGLRSCWAELRIRKTSGNGVPIPAGSITGVGDEFPAARIILVRQIAEMLQVNLPRMLFEWVIDEYI